MSSLKFGIIAIFSVGIVDQQFRLQCLTACLRVTRVRNQLLSASALSLLAATAERSPIGTTFDVLEWADTEAPVLKAVAWRTWVAWVSTVSSPHCTAARVEPEGRMEAIHVDWLGERRSSDYVALEGSQPPSSRTSTTALVEKAVSTGGGGQPSEELGEDVPDGDGDACGDGIKRTRVEVKSDDGMSTVTATANKIDDDRFSQEPRKLKKSKAVRKFKFASVIDQCDGIEVPAPGQTQIDEHFERVRMLKGSFPLVDCETTNDQISAMWSRVENQGLAPYVDFGVFVPFRLRFSKLLLLPVPTFSKVTFLSLRLSHQNQPIGISGTRVGLCTPTHLLGLVHTALGGADVLGELPKNCFETSQKRGT